MRARHVSPGRTSAIPALSYPRYSSRASPSSSVPRVSEDPTTPIIPEIRQAYSRPFESPTGRLRAVEGLETLGEDFDELRVERFDHDAHQRFGPGRTNQESHVVAVHGVDREQFVKEFLDHVVAEVFHRDAKELLRYASPCGPR